MALTLSDNQKRLLAAIFGRGSGDASEALSRWLGRSVKVSVSEVDQVDLEEASEVLGPSDALVAACPMELTGVLTGQVILVFEDRSGLATVDLILNQPVGTTTSWGELEQSAAKETANIVGCAYLNSLAAHLPALASDPGSSEAASLLPGPPGFRHEFAASLLLEFALMDQRPSSDRLLVIKTAPPPPPPPLPPKANATGLVAAVRPQRGVARSASVPRSGARSRPDLGSFPIPQRRSIVSLTDKPVPPEEMISVLMGRWAVASAPTLIRTLLGSCAGVVLYDRMAKLGGVAHIVFAGFEGVDRSSG